MAVIKQHDYKVVRYSLLVLFIFLSIVVIVSSINPQERAKKELDSRRQSLSSLIISSLERYYYLKGKYPWAAYLGSKSPAPALPWTVIQAKELGICKDFDCETYGEVSDLVSTLEGQIKLQKDDTLFLGKGVNVGDPLYICFEPVSETNRKNTSKLYQVDILSETSAPQKLEFCPDRVSWEENDVCYYCVSNSK